MPGMSNTAIVIFAVIAGLLALFLLILVSVFLVTAIRVGRALKKHRQEFMDEVKSTKDVREFAGRPLLSREQIDRLLKPKRGCCGDKNEPETIVPNFEQRFGGAKQSPKDPKEKKD